MRCQDEMCSPGTDGALMPPGCVVTCDVPSHWPPARSLAGRPGKKCGINYLLMWVKGLMMGEPGKAV